MMRVHVIAVPYDSGRRGERMGAGPEHLLRGGLAERLRADGHEVRVSFCELPSERWPGEVGSTFELAAQVARAVQSSREAGEFPLVLSGNCGPAAIGCVAGLRPPVEVWWFDAHGDLNTPETSMSGFVDGMALAVVTGRCWSRIAGTVPGFEPVEDRSVVLVGARDLDAAEASLLESSAIGVVRAGEIRDRLDSLLSGSSGQAARAYLHIDLDVLDAKDARVNAFAVGGGLGQAKLTWALQAVARTRSVEAAAFTAYEPKVDGGGRAREAGIEVVLALVSEIGRKSTASKGIA